MPSPVSLSTSNPAPHFDCLGLLIYIFFSFSIYLNKGLQIPIMGIYVYIEDAGFLKFARQTLCEVKGMTLIFGNTSKRGNKALFLSLILKYLEIVM